MVGAGVFGLSTALEAGRRRRHTLVVDRRAVPNPVSASYGPSRKIRSTRKLSHPVDRFEVDLPGHACLFGYGVALLDNALLEPLVRACAEEGRDELMLAIAPLEVAGGTGRRPSRSPCSEEGAMPVAAASGAWPAVTAGRITADGLPGMPAASPPRGHGG